MAYGTTIWFSNGRGNSEAIDTFLYYVACAPDKLVMKGLRQTFRRIK